MAKLNNTRPLISILLDNRKNIVLTHRSTGFAFKTERAITRTQSDVECFSCLRSGNDLWTHRKTGTLHDLTVRSTVPLSTLATQ